MNLSIFLGIVALVISVHASPHVKLSTGARLSQTQIDDLRDRIAAVGGCNANVCFAIDGSRSLAKSGEFEAEKNFVLDLMAVIGVDDAVEVAAVQYGTSSSAISPLTANLEDFITKVADEKPLKSKRTFVAAGINYCFGQLFRRPGEANKIVLLGTAKSQIGSSAVRRANEFRQATGGEVCTVAAGFADTRELLAIAGGDPEKVFLVGSFLEVLKLQALIEGLVEGICNINLHPPLPSNGPSTRTYRSWKQ